MTQDTQAQIKLKKWYKALACSAGWIFCQTLWTLFLSFVLKTLLQYLMDRACDYLIRRSWMMKKIQWIWSIWLSVTFNPRSHSTLGHKAGKSLFIWNLSKWISNLMTVFSAKFSVFVKWSLLFVLNLRSFPPKLDDKGCRVQFPTPPQTHVLSKHTHNSELTTAHTERPS